MINLRYVALGLNRWMAATRSSPEPWMSLPGIEIAVASLLGSSGCDVHTFRYLEVTIVVDTRG